jgi:hypothetical protein
MDNKWTMIGQRSPLIRLVQDGQQMDDDCSKKFTHIPSSRQTTNGRLFKAVHSYSLFNTDNQWTTTFQSSSLIFLVQDGLQTGDDCSEQFTHISYSRQTTNGRWMFKAALLYSAFEQNYNGAVTCPKYSAHSHLTTTFKKSNSSSPEVKTPNETGRQGRVWVSLCLHLAPCLRKSNFLLGLFLAELTYSVGPNRLSRLLVICSGWRGYYAK